MGHFGIASLLLFASVGPTVTPIDEAHFRVAIIYDDKSVMGHAQAQISLMQAAAKRCQGKGEAVNPDGFEVRTAEPLRKGKDALELHSTYSCQPKTGQPKSGEP